MRFARLFAACCAVLCVAVGSPARAQESYPTFLGATLGQPAQDLRATLGDPLQVTTTTDAGIKAGLPAQRWARFWIPPGNAFALIGEREGVVTSIELFIAGAVTGPVAGLPATDVSIGMTADEAISKRGAPTGRAQNSMTYLLKGGLAEGYGIQNGFINTITFLLLPNLPASTINPKAGPALAPFREADGTTAETAILDMMPTETPGVRFEYLWIAYHPCDGLTQWKRGNQGMSIVGARKFDKFHLVCESTHAERDLWFDITPYFGKF